MTTNPGVLKLDLALRGARLGAGVKNHPDLAAIAGQAEGAARSLELVLPEEVWVCAPVGGAEASPFELRAEGDAFVVAGDGQRCEVRIIPPPTFYGQTTRGGVPMRQVGAAYGGYLAIDPAAGGEVGPRPLADAFCDESGPRPAGPTPLAVNDVVETVRAAFAEGAVEFVYLHTARPDDDSAGVEFIEPYVRAIKRHFDTLVAVQLAPPRENRWIDRAYAIGVDGISYAVGIHDEATLARHCPQRMARVGRERYYEALRHAASIFPSGTVWSTLVVGAEPAASTIAGIDALVGMGVLPVLSVFRGADDAQPQPGAADVAPVLAHLFRAVRDARINMHWVRDLSFAVTPIEARFFAGDEARASVGTGQFYRSRLGALAARNLSRLRRRLRVRQVSDSFDSSHL